MREENIFFKRHKMRLLIAKLWAVVQNIPYFEEKGKIAFFHCRLKVIVSDIHFVREKNTLSVNWSGTLSRGTSRSVFLTTLNGKTLVTERRGALFRKIR